MARALLPALPPELEDRIACEVLAAEGSGVQAWVRLSLVCRSWRDNLRGVPVHATLGAEIAPEQLQAVLRGKPITSVTLHDSDVEYEVLLYHDLPLEQRVPALAASAPQLTAIPGLFLKELQDSPQPGLAGLSQLRALTLQQTPGDQQDLYGTALPSGLEALRLQAAAPYYCSSCPPTLIGFGRLHHLRRLTIAGYGLGALYTDEAVDGVLRIADLPPCLEVLRFEYSHAPLCAAGAGRVPLVCMGGCAAGCCCVRRG